RIEQIDWMRQAIKRRFGVEASGLWLTERVWEPELAADLAQAGVRYALVDDRHFLVSGFSGDRLHAPFWAESDRQGGARCPGGWRDPPDHARRGARRGTERRARVSADGFIPRDGGLGASAGGRHPARAARARSRARTARRPRRGAGPGGALAQFLRALSRVEPD